MVGRGLVLQFFPLLLVQKINSIAHNKMQATSGGGSVAGWCKITQRFFFSPSLFCLLFAEVLLQLCTYTQTITVWSDGSAFTSYGASWWWQERSDKGKFIDWNKQSKFGCKLKFTGKVLRCIANLKVLPQVSRSRKFHHQRFESIQLVKCRNRGREKKLHSRKLTTIMMTNSNFTLRTLLRCFNTVYSKINLVLIVMLHRLENMVAVKYWEPK